MLKRPRTATRNPIESFKGLTLLPAFGWLPDRKSYLLITFDGAAYISCLSVGRGETAIRFAFACLQYTRKRRFENRFRTIVTSIRLKTAIQPLKASYPSKTAPDNQLVIRRSFASVWRLSSIPGYRFFCCANGSFSVSSIIAPPRHTSPAYSTALCPGVTARCGSSAARYSSSFHATIVAGWSGWR